MTWDELIREYYKKCMELDCAIDIHLDTSELGAHYIMVTAHKGKYRNRKIVSYIGLGGGGVVGRMFSYDLYKQYNGVVDDAVNYMVKEINEKIEKSYV